jgi:hypothetical protein
MVATLQIATAQRALSTHNIRINDGSPFRVMIDGREAGPAGTMAQITNLQPGKHYLQVFRTVRTWGYHGNSQLFAGSVVLTPNTESFATVMPEYGKIKFDRIVAINNGWEQRPNNDKLCLYPQAPVIGPGQPIAPCGPVAMNPNDFMQLKQTLDNASFESTRLTIFKQALGYNNFTTGQVREIMELFWFESSKLEVAKLAYPKTIDQNNYYLVNNSFSFSSSVNELGDYIAMR